MAESGDIVQSSKDTGNKNNIVDATVIKIEDESPSVKRLILKIEDRTFSFKPGQWVDTFIPGIETITGFSMCSSPDHFDKTGEIELAVQYSTYPPADWVHTKCSVGSTVKLQVGGDFYYYAEKSEQKLDLLLIAGGVGINPLISTMRHAEDLNEGSCGQSEHFGRLMLLYSARSKEELIFYKEIKEIGARNSNIASQLFTTKEQGTDPAIKYRRIEAGDITNALNWLKRDVTQVFICGPSSMITDMQSTLGLLNFPEERIHFESWWRPHKE